ncbi:MAG: CPBP family intramembrane metalloprotease [Anaerolineales bacterium]|nr:CPBP family intramembrane metalloprotease [Anaerolineales bacterium]
MRINQLRLDWKAATAIVVTTLLMVVEGYHRLLPHDCYDRTLLYLGVPLLVIILVFRESPANYGFGLGDWKAGLVITAVACAGVLLLTLLLARIPSFQTYYAPLNGLGLPLTVMTALDLLGWEFMLRGFLLFALYRVCGPLAILIQAMPFTIAHIGKPELEALSCIFGGSLFGYIAWRTRSFVYPFLIHWLLETLVILLAAG